MEKTYLMDPVFPCVAITDIENDHLILQFNLDDEYNYHSLLFTIYPKDPESREEETVWDNPEYLFDSLFPALDLYVSTAEMTKIIYELTETYTNKEIISMYKIFVKYFDFIEKFNLQQSNFDDDVYNDCE